MRQRTDRIFLNSDPTPIMRMTVQPVRPISVSGEIWVGDRTHDVPAPRSSRLVVVRGRRHYLG